MISLWTRAAAERGAKVRSALDRDILVYVWYCDSGYVACRRAETRKMKGPLTKVTAYQAGECTFRHDLQDAETLHRERQRMHRERGQREAGHGGGT